MKHQKIIALFDFDGTLTTKDTLLEFIRFSCGNWQFCVVFFLYSPIIGLMFLKVIPNWWCKEKVLSHFFKGMPKVEFEELGRRFVNRALQIQKKETVKILERHLSEGHQVYIVSASVPDWIAPFAATISNEIKVLGTELETDNQGKMTGHLLTKNCYGPEKVNRIISAIPQLAKDRESYYIYAYGDSHGDDAMLQFADKGIKIKR